MYFMDYLEQLRITDMNKFEEEMDKLRDYIQKYDGDIKTNNYKIRLCGIADLYVEKKIIEDCNQIKEMINEIEKFEFSEKEGCYGNEREYTMVCCSIRKFKIVFGVPHRMTEPYVSISGVKDLMAMPEHFAISDECVCIAGESEDFVCSHRCSGEEIDNIKEMVDGDMNKAFGCILATLFAETYNKN